MPLSTDDIAFERTGSGPPMLLVHGCPATHTLWRPLVPELARRRTVYAIDLPGFGGSRAPDDPSDLALPRLVETLLAFASHHGIERFDLAGHSFGGAISASVAAASPDRVRSLVMLAPMGCAPPPLARTARLPLMQRVAPAVWRFLPGGLRRAVAGSGVRMNYGSAYRSERAAEIASEMNRRDAVRAICRLCTAFDYEEYRRRLADLESQRAVPTLMIGAGRDRIVPIEHFRELCSLVPSAEQEFFDDGVHVVMWQYPEPIARRILSFIDRDIDHDIDRTGA